MQAANEAIDELKDQLRAAQTSAARDRAKKSAAGRRRLVNRAKEAAAEVLKAPEGGADEAEAAAS